jgi:LysM repeat protein
MPPIDLSAAVTDLSYGGDITAEAIPDNGEYMIQGGDTLLGIALRFGLDWQDIALANNMAEDELLQIGRTIRLPIVGGTGGPAAAGTVVAGKQVHVVRPGETLWTIAARYSITWQEVAGVNGLGESDLLQIGDELKLPASLDEAPAVDEAASDGLTATGESSNEEAQETSAARSEEGARFIQSAAPPSSSESTGDLGETTYTVKSGDTLLGIALAHDLAWETLAEANGLDEESFLQIGQDLVIPGSLQLFADRAATGGALPPSTRTHRIEAGDTVFALALRYEIDWQELLRINGLNEASILQPGQELLLP